MPAEKVAPATGAKGASVRSWYGGPAVAAQRVPFTGDVDQFNRRMRSFRAANAFLRQEKAALTARYPDQFVAVDENGVVAVAPTSRELADRLDALGCDGASRRHRVFGDQAQGVAAVITGSVTAAGYFVEAEVKINPDAQPALITFLVDTGAGMTAVHPSDIYKLALPQAALAEAETVRIHGIGGYSTYRLIAGELAFQNDASAMPIRYITTLYIAEATDDNSGIPSLLGRDILNHWRVWEINPDSGVIRFTPAEP